MVRLNMGLSKQFVLLVLSTLVGAYSFLIYVLVFAEDSDKIPDHVIRQGEVFGETAQFRLMPLFYNCFATALLFVLRLLWRVVRNDFDMLLVLGGALTYENYLRKTKGQVSRRHGSYLQQWKVQKVAPPHQDLVLVSR
uniref:Uncharacterized protein n=1 Tax=Globisporangium ultimum (strain ATCC 200006 / CBS 805.95 / DAOM BR144) TaxID=431595 RepID=K3WU22_GLOUD